MNDRIAIIGGLGHVGLPLGLWLAACGYEVMALDRDEAKARLVRDGKMPFIEHGAQEILDRVQPATFRVTAADSFGLAVEQSKTIIVTIGTPLDEHLNPRLEPVINCISELLPYLRDGQHVMLRSTVFPGTTRRVDAFLKGAGKKIDVSFCPERIVQGYAIKELRELPAIVSGCTPEAVARAKEIFQRLSGSDLYAASIEVTPEEAELAKLYLNSWRYIQFAAANQFYAIADKLGADYEAIRRAMTWRYPRGESLPGPGFAAGPCLVKDTMQLAAAAPDGFQMGVAARQANEGLPGLLVAKLKRQMGSLAGKKVGILGMAFKAGSDDTRDSLSFRLAKILRFEGATVLCSDEYAPAFRGMTAEGLLNEADAVIVGVAHERYRGMQCRVPTVDVWRVLEQVRTVEA